MFAPKLFLEISGKLNSSPSSLQLLPQVFSYYLQFPTITSMSLQLLPPISKSIACFLAPTSLLQECSDESKGVLYLTDTSFKRPSKKFKMAIDLSEHAMVDMCIKLFSLYKNILWPLLKPQYQQSSFGVYFHATRDE